MMRNIVRKANLSHRTEEIILALFVLVPHIYITFSPENSLLNWYHTDDAFYYFVTARNISEGLGVTFDGLNPTNGFHPLWMLICIPVFSLARFDLYLPLRILILIQAALSIGSGILVLRMCRKHLAADAALVVAFIWTLVPSLHRVVAIGGVESGLNAFSITLLWYVLTSLLDSHSSNQIDWRSLAKLGVVASMVVLSRLDNAFIVAFVGIWVILRMWNYPKKVTQKSLDQWKERGVLALSFALPILILLGSYLLWNSIQFDSAMPVSGRVKLWWGTLGEKPYGSPPATIGEFYSETFTSIDIDRSPWAVPYTQLQTVVQAANEFLQNLGLPMVVRTLWLLAGMVLILLVEWRFTYKGIIGLGLPPLFLAVMAQIIYYKGTTHVAHRSWYWVMELFFTVLLLGLFVAALFRILQRLSYGKVLTKAVSIILVITIVVSHVLYVLDLVPPRAPPQHPYTQLSTWLEDNTEDGSIIAMTGAGALGYFTRGRTIVNMDGVINSMAYFRSLQYGTAADHLASNQVDYIFGDPAIIEGKIPYRRMLEGKLVRLKQENQFVLWRFNP